MTQLFVDMDGVLADFDAHHEAVFGVRSDKLLDNVDWKMVRTIPHFYRDIPPMAEDVELPEAPGVALSPRRRLPGRLVDDPIPDMVPR